MPYPLPRNSRDALGSKDNAELLTLAHFRFMVAECVDQIDNRVDEAENLIELTYNNIKLLGMGDIGPRQNIKLEVSDDIAIGGSHGDGEINYCVYDGLPDHRCVA